MLEEARGEFYRSLGFPLRDLQQRDLIFPVVECQIQYKTPAHYDDCLKVEVWLTEMGRVKLRFDYRILREDGTLIVTASTLHVCSSTREKLKRLPAEIAQALQPHLRTAL